MSGRVNVRQIGRELEDGTVVQVWQKETSPGNWVDFPVSSATVEEFGSLGTYSGEELPTPEPPLPVPMEGDRRRVEGGVGWEVWDGEKWVKDESRLALKRVVINVGCGGLFWHGLPRYATWYGPWREESQGIYVDGDVLERRNEGRQWLIGRIGQYKVDAVEKVLRGMGMGEERTDGGFRPGAWDVYVVGSLGKQERETKVSLSGSGLMRGEGREEVEAWSKRGLFLAELDLGGYVRDRVEAEEAWLFGLVDNHMARVCLYEMGEKIVEGGHAGAVYVCSAGNNVMGGWAAVCKMTKEEGRVVKKGDWKVYRADIWKEAEEERAGRSGAQQCAAMGEQSAGSNGMTVQCLWGCVGAAMDGWFGEYTWKYVEPSKRKPRHIVVNMIERK